MSDRVTDLASRAREARGGIDLLAAGLVALGVYHLALGVFMVVAPGTFFAEIGPFGVQNDHYIRDTATFNLAFAAALLAAVRHRTWRVPVLVVLLVQFALHTVNHLVDIGEAEPEAIGVVDFVSLLVGSLLIAGLLVLAHHESGAAKARPAEPGRRPSP